MALYDPAYSLLTVIAALIVGVLIGRITSSLSDPRRAEIRKRRERDADFHAVDNLARLSEETRARIARLVAEGHPIEAVRACRAELNVGLKEAKDVVNLARSKADRGAHRSAPTVGRPH